MRGHVLLSAEALQQSWARWARAGNTTLTDICIDWGDTLYAVGTPSVSPTDRSTVYEHPGYRRERTRAVFRYCRKGEGVCGHSRIWPDIVKSQYRIQNTLHSSSQPGRTGTRITTDWYLISDMVCRNYITVPPLIYTAPLSEGEGEGEREVCCMYSLYLSIQYRHPSCRVYRPVQHVTTSSPATTSQQCIVDIIVWQSNLSFK